MRSCGFVFYLDPKIAVGTIITLDGGIVLVRRAIEPGYGKWVFPGGYVDRGEEITLAAIREAREESGLDVRIDRLINIYSYAGRTPIVVVYAATCIGGELAVDDEGLEARAFAPDAIPWEDARVPQHARSVEGLSGPALGAPHGFWRALRVGAFHRVRSTDSRCAIPPQSRRAKRAGYATVTSGVRYTSWIALSRPTPSLSGRWKALRPEIRPMPPARLLITAVFTASLRSLSPDDAPPELINPARPM